MKITDTERKQQEAKRGQGDGFSKWRKITSPQKSDRPLLPLEQTVKPPGIRPKQQKTQGKSVLVQN
jgi:hypothetical protein